MDPWVKSQLIGGEEQKRWKEKTEKKIVPKWGYFENESHGGI